MGQTASAILKIDGRKVANMTEATATVKSNGQLMPTADDIIKSKGKATAEVTFGAIIPVRDLSVNVGQLTISQKVCSVTMQHGGGMIEVVGTFDQAAYKTAVNTGSTDLNGTFSGSVRVIP